MSKSSKWFISFLAAALLLTALYHMEFAAPQAHAEPEQFIVPLGASRAEIAKKLAEEGFVKSASFIKLLISLKIPHGIEPGGYKISKARNAWEVTRILAESPYMKWVVIPEGLRKEEIAELLAVRLGWDETKKERWIKTDTARENDYREGVYFPDTYLIPTEESGTEVAQRFINRFNEVFAPYAAEFQKANIKWTTALKIASLIERESTGGREDQALIAGIIWNRLEKNMTLDIDATLQYARGNTPNGWWAPITQADKKLNSPFNTYLRKGLPPTPIANPGLAAIEATLHPANTKCLFYLHDAAGKIHCAETYEEHKTNIQKYLRKN